jgi:hypothetical protein
MSLWTSIKTIVNSNVKLAAWLTYVGAMLSLGGLVFLHHSFGVPAVYLGNALVVTGIAYNQIYPS